MILSRAILATLVGCFWIVVGAALEVPAAGAALGLLSASFIFVASYRGQRNRGVRKQ